MTYRVFTRTWWKNNPSWPNGLEPCAGPKHTLSSVVETEDEAREICRDYNDHPPAARDGRLSRKAEYTSD